MFTKQQKKFVKEYLKTLNGADAAIKAGYKASCAAATAAALLENERLTELFEAEIQKMLAALDVPVAYIVKRLVSIAEFGIQSEEGSLRDPALALKALDSLCKRIPATNAAQSGIKIENLDFGKL